MSVLPEVGDAKFAANVLCKYDGKGWIVDFAPRPTILRCGCLYTSMTVHCVEGGGEICECPECGATWLMFADRLRYVRELDCSFLLPGSQPWEGGTP